MDARLLQPERWAGHLDRLRAALPPDAVAVSFSGSMSRGQHGGSEWYVAAVRRPIAVSSVYCRRNVFRHFGVGDGAPASHQSTADRHPDQRQRSAGDPDRGGYLGQ